MSHKVHGHNCTIKKAGPYRQFEIDLIGVRPVGGYVTPEFEVDWLMEVKNPLHVNNVDKAVRQVIRTAEGVKARKRFVINFKY
jgi:hypothetical protein